MLFHRLQMAFLSTFNDICVFYLHVCMCTGVDGACRGQKGAPDLPELEL